MKTTTLLALLSLAWTSSQAKPFQLLSKDLQDGDTLDQRFFYNGFGCTGQNLSPELHWQNAPTGTKSFVIQAYDPDAPTGSGWWHWTVFNLPASTNALSTGQKSLPTGAIQSLTDFGSKGYGGACPPPGPAHRYIFTITALDVDKLPLDSTAMPALLGYMTQAHKIASAQFTVYGRRP